MIAYYYLFILLTLTQNFNLFCFVYIISRCPNFGSKCDCEACCQKHHAESTSKLAETFPSILTAEGKKSPPRKDSCCSHNKADLKETINTTDIIEDLSKTLEDSKIQDSKSKITAKDQIHQQPLLSSTKPKGLQLASVQQQQPQNQQGATDLAAEPQKKSTTAKELRDLMYQHYCVGKYGITK